MHTIGVSVKAGVYGSIAIAWYMSIFGTLGQPGLQEWRPFALIALFVAITLLALMGVSAPPRKPEADGLGESARL